MFHGISETDSRQIFNENSAVYGISVWSIQLMIYFPFFMLKADSLVLALSSFFVAWQKNSAG